ncbi:paeninodin family lasso peptide [Sporosarcina thermotolerans]|uniref:Paeninodin family lasso peptide n=1 Tax=Sporosarcina thermotolerans TaxID=633404 RepID=A0AAW9AAW5_9BACL|nr:paeninodin family lasso peptide [Sporosarcina thermotolerans]MDW0116268.1 paeninodin family lasso peptide [Sporosarcina thermotolerans]WHT48242.1 paeninodin family lasso peptide [Sporosarcina thermotolerans]
MKMEWKKPELEVLDVNQTMLGRGGQFTDKAFDAKTPISEITTS